MNIEEIEIDFEEMKKFKEENFRERLRFVKLWADYVKTHKDEEWSEQQNVIIDAQIFSD